MSSRKSRTSYREEVPEQCKPPYAAIPHAVMSHAAYTGATSNAIRLLLDLVQQHNGRNNGRLQATWSYLNAKRGWTSVSALKKALEELIDRRLVIRTRRGGRTFGQIDFGDPPPVQGPAFYALTWLPITEFRGLEITGNDFWPGGWDLGNPLPRPKKSKGRAGIRGMPEKATDPSDDGNTVYRPLCGAETAP